MRNVVYVTSGLLWIWFFGCIVTYRIKNIVLVEGMGVKSFEFVMLILFSVGIITFTVHISIGKWVLLCVLALWLSIQFFCHWYYTIFGVTEKKLIGYNHCFRNTFRLVPMSKTRLIPDFYHIILHLLILLNFVLTVVSILSNK